MSNRVQGLVYDYAPYDDARFNILLALADEANDDGYAYLSIPKLARKARVSYRNTIYVVQSLERDKVGDTGEKMLRVRRHNQRGLSNDYEINVGLLDSLPFYWPEPLAKGVAGKLRVQPLHPKKNKPVENSIPKGAIRGKNRVQEGCNEDAIKGAVVAPLPCHVDPGERGHDLSTPGVDRLSTVENRETNDVEQFPLFEDGTTSRLLVDGLRGDSALPKGGRWVRHQSGDPGGWSSVEVLTAYKELVPRPPNDKDKKALAEIGRLNFSTDMTIYLMQAIKRKGSKKDPPNSMTYFLVALTRLALDVKTALRVADDAETWQMTAPQRYWYQNSLVQKEIILWERWLSRS